MKDWLSWLDADKYRSEEVFADTCFAFISIKPKYKFSADQGKNFWVWSRDKSAIEAYSDRCNQVFPHTEEATMFSLTIRFFDNLKEAIAEVKARDSNQETCQWPDFDKVFFSLDATQEENPWGHFLLSFSLALAAPPSTWKRIEEGKCYDLFAEVFSAAAKIRPTLREREIYFFAIPAEIQKDFDYRISMIGFNVCINERYLPDKDLVRYILVHFFTKYAARNREEEYYMKFGNRLAKKTGVPFVKRNLYIKKYHEMVYFKNFPHA